MRYGLLALAFIAALAAGASGRDAPQEPAARFTAAVGTEYVQIPVVVTDRKGRFVDDLGRSDFHLWIDAKAAPIESFERDIRGPVSFAILLDVSGSMRIADKLERAKDAIRRLVERRRPGDDFALFTFSDDEVRVVEAFSPDPAPMLRQLLFLKPEGRTGLYDAVIQTANELLTGHNSKRAILLFTDGVDNASQLTEQDLDQVMQNEGVPVYAIGMKNAAFDVLSEEQRRELSVATLEKVAQASGGRMFLVSGGDDLRPISDAVETELRRQYVLGFEPSGEGDVKYHPIFVTVTGGGTRVVRARRGYRGTAPKVGK